MRRLLLLPLLLSCAVDVAAAVSGRVIAEDGSPVVAARIRVFRLESSDEWMNRIVSESPEPVPLATAETTVSGSFSIETKANPFVVMVIDKGSQLELRQAADGDSGQTIVLTSNLRRGRVVAQGKPVPNALIVHSRLLVTRSDAQGAFEVPPSRTQFGEILAMAPGYAVGIAPSTWGERANAFDIVLQRGVAIRGQVVAADGSTPVADAVVAVNGIPLGKSGQDGTFVLSHASPGWRSVTATETNRVAMATRAASPQYLLRLRPAATLAGIVRSSQDDAPVGGARVFVNALDLMQRWAVTDAKGAFALGGLSAGSYRVVPGRAGFTAGMAPEYRVAEGARLNRSLVLHPMARLTGHVVNEEKKPVAGAELVSGGERARTAPDGTFELFLPPMSRGGMVTVRKAGYAPATAGPFHGEDRGEKRSVDIVLSRGIGFRLRVVDGGGVAVANEPVVISLPSDEEDGSPDVFVCRASECRTNSDGVLETRLVAGTYDVVVGGQTVPLARSRQVISSQSSSATITVDRGSTIAGRVVAAEGSTLPESGLVVSAREHQLRESAAGIPIEPDGSFVIRNLPVGRVTLFVQQFGPGQQASGPEVAVTAPATGVELTAPRTHRIEGRVVDRESGQAIRDFSVTQRRYRGAGYSASAQQFRSDEGRFTLENVATTSLDLTISAPGYAQAVVSNVSTEDRKEPIEVRLERGGTVAGRVTKSGRAVAEASIGVVGEGRAPGGGFPMVMTDGSGEFTIEGLAAGDYVLQVNRRGLSPARKGVEVAVGRESRVDIEIPEGSDLSGRVVDDAGRPVARARVTSRIVGSGPTSPVETDADGAFKLEGLNGRGTIMAEKSGYVSATAENVDVATAGSLTLTLKRGGTITGQVRGLSRSEIALVRINANGPNGTRTSTRPDPSGQFTLTGIADGTVLVRASINGPTERAAQKTVDVTGGAAPPVDLEFSDTIVVRGRITRAGAPLPLALIWFQPVKRSSRALAPPRAQANADGLYEARIAETGEYRVNVESGSAGTIDAGTVNVSGPMTHDIDLRGSGLRGRVIDSATNAALPGVMVSASRLEGRGSMNATTDSEGRFAFDAVPAGRYRFSTSKQRYMNAIEDVDIREGGTPDVELRMKEGDRVVVRVIDVETRRPVDSVSLTVADGAKKTLYSGMPFREDDGGFRVWLVPGRYTARVFSPQYVGTTVELTVPGAETVVAMSRAGRIVLQGRREGVVRMRLIDMNTGRTINQTGVPPGVFESVRAGAYKVEILDDQQNVVGTFNVNVLAGQTATVPVG